MGFHNSGGGGGERLVETVLWTNPDPTSDFAAQTVNLSDSIGNYDYIAFTYKLQKAQTATYKVYYSAAEVLAWRAMTDSGTYLPFGVIGGRSDENYKRLLAKEATNQVSFSTATGMANSTASNGMITPLQVIGVKRSLSGGGGFTPTQEILILNQGTATSADNVYTFTQDYDIVCINSRTWRSAGSGLSEGQIIEPTLSEGYTLTLWDSGITSNNRYRTQLCFNVKSGDSIHTLNVNTSLNSNYQVYEVI